MPATQQVRFSKSIDAYVRALTNPYSSIAPLPGIPADLALPSHKFKTRVRVTLGIGTNGSGYAILRPMLGAFSDTIAMDYDVPAVANVPFYPVTVTDVTWTGTTLQEYNAATGARLAGLVGCGSDSPFTRADFEDASDFYPIRKYRLVAAGIKVRYRGKEVDRAGTITLYRSTANSANTPADEASLLRSHHATRAPVDRKWHSVTYRPSDPSMYAYNSISPYVREQGGDDRVHGLTGSETRGHAPAVAAIIMITGGTPDTTYDLEADMHFEQIGPGVTLSVTPTDPVGMSAVISANNLVQNTRQPEHEHAQMLKGMVNHVSKHITTSHLATAAKVAKSVGTSALAAYGASKAVPAALSAIETVGEDVLPLLTML